MERDPRKLLNDANAVKDPAARIERLRALVSGFPDFAAAWFNLAVDLHSEGRVEDAVAARARAISLDPQIAAHLPPALRPQPPVERVTVEEDVLGIGLHAGATIAGRYAIREHLASGGMAAVYLATDSRLGVPVAIKVLAVNGASYARAFEREARWLAALRHEGVPHCTDWFVERGRPCMVLQHIAGEGLDAVVARGAPEPQRALAWADDLLGVLEYLHGQDPPILHSDIKPGNLKLTPEGRLVLLDLGVATTKGAEAPLPGGAALSASYAAPEQFRGTGLEIATDLFGAGATLYHLLTRRAPVDAQARMQARAVGRPDPLRSPSELEPRVPLPISSLVESALSLDAGRRPASAREMRGQLAALRARFGELTRLAPTTPAPKNAEAPTVHAERFRVLRPLGEGGMGQVFVAHDAVSGREVCLKRLLPTVAREALRQECEAFARLDHPGIVRLIDYQLDSAQPFMVTELVRGPTLDPWIERSLPVEAPVAVEMGRRLLDAVIHAHERDVIHCDLKPANVLLVRSGAGWQPKILDFGLAIVDRVDDRGNTTGAGRIAGTPRYMAPEQFRGAVLSPACDVYALGIMIAELLGEKPAIPAGSSIADLALRNPLIKCRESGHIRAAREQVHRIAA